jgi:NadR type nicotinamide-nucleotide adenylyltransferase
MRRLVVTGSESSGKTTLARLVADATGAPMLSEAARDYAEKRRARGESLTASDVEPIARRAIADEDRLVADRAPTMIVRDTDLISTVAYARHYYGACPEWIGDEAARRRADLYLLCAPDLPWVADGVRDEPHARDRMHALFVATLAEFDAVVADVSMATPASVTRAIDMALELQARC